MPIFRNGFLHQYNGCGKHSERDFKMLGNWDLETKETRCIFWGINNTSLEVSDDLGKNESFSYEPNKKNHLASFRLGNRSCNIQNKRFHNNVFVFFCLFLGCFNLFQHSNFLLHLLQRILESWNHHSLLFRL